MGHTWLIGVGLSIFGACVDNLGVTTQKYSHMQNRKLPLYLQRPYYRQRTWIWGFSLFLFGNGCNAVGLGLTPETLFAAIGGVTLVANSINSHFLLGENITLRILLSTLIIISGSVLAVTFSSHPDENFDLHDLENFFLRRTFIIYICCLVGGLLILYYVIHRLDPPQKSTEVEVTHPRHDPHHNRRLSSHATHATLSPDVLAVLPQDKPEVGADALEDQGGNAAVPLDENATDISTVVLEIGPLIRTESAQWRFEHKEWILQFLSFAVPAFAGMVGSITVLLAKSSAELIRRSIRGDNQFRYPVPYFLIVGTIISGCIQVHWLNLGLKSYKQLVVVPSFYVCYTTFTIMGGAFFFNETRDFSTTEYAVFSLATLLTFLGVYLIATRPHERGDFANVEDATPAASPIVRSESIKRGLYPPHTTASDTNSLLVPAASRSSNGILRSNTFPDYGSVEAQ